MNENPYRAPSEEGEHKVGPARTIAEAAGTLRVALCLVFVALAIFLSLVAFLSILWRLQT